MVKSIIKELIIVLLLCLVIMLALGILLYEYIPTTKIIPTQVAYTTPEEVKKELLTSSEVNDNQIVMTYEVDSADLNNYKKVQDYKPGKANPFSSYESQVAEGNTSTNGSSQEGTNNNSSGTTTNNTTTSSDGKFFQDTGTK